MRAWWLLLLILVPMAAAQTSTTQTSTSHTSATADDPAMGSADELRVSHVTAHGAAFDWTWSPGCSQTVRLYLLVDGNETVRAVLPAVDGAMHHRFSNLTAGTSYTAYVAAAHNCGVIGGHDLVEFTTPTEGRDAPGFAMLLAAGTLGLVAWARRKT